MIENNNNNIQHTVIQTYGYTEMYEWMNNPEDIDNQGCGMFVQFTKQEPEKIEPYDGSGVFCGVTTATAQDTSDNPSEWHKKYVVNEYDKRKTETKYIAVGNKNYDQLNEISFVRTFPYEVIKNVISSDFDVSKHYIQRDKRINWTRVNLLGKCIVKDNGKCVPGKWCQPYVGPEYEKCGSAIPAKKNDQLKFYVLSRVSPNTILIKL